MPPGTLGPGLAPLPPVRLYRHLTHFLAQLLTRFPTQLRMLPAPACGPCCVQLGKLPNVTFNRLPFSDWTGYAPVNSPFSISDISKWQPERLISPQGFPSGEQDSEPGKAEYAEHANCGRQGTVLHSILIYCAIRSTRPFCQMKQGRLSLCAVCLDKGILYCVD